MNSHGRLFKNSWWIVIGSMLALIVGNGPVGLFTFGVFLKPVSSEFGWERGTMSMAIGVSLFCGAIATPIIGYLIDRWGIRRVTLPLIVLFALSMASIAFTPASPIVFVLLYAIAGTFGAGQAPLPYAKAISSWFDQRRGLALGIAMAGAGIGVAVIPQLARLLIEIYGWRGAYVGVGIVTFVVAFPAAALFLREQGEPLADAGRQAAVSRAIPPGKSVGEAFANYRFWFIAIATFLVVTALNGTINHAIPLLTDRGISPSTAASILGIVGMSTIAGRLVSGYLVDRFFAPFVAVFFFLLPIVGIYLLGSGEGMPIVVVGGVTLGVTLGAEVDLIGFLVSRYFGLRHFGAISGYLFAIFTAASGFGPFLMGLCYDAFHSYNLALTGFAMALIIASLMIALLGPYAFPGRSAVRS
jgi:predicted MFS family arabinose efflux permease